MRKKVTATALVAIAALTAACGNSSNDNARASTTKTVEIEMVDIGFQPKTVEVDKGTLVKFVFTNTGKLEHEAFLGPAMEQEAHEKEMSSGDKGSGSMGGHDMGSSKEASAITVKPGEKGELATTFGDAGTYEIGCHEPGHYAAGMKVTVEVS